MELTTMFHYAIPVICVILIGIIIKWGYYEYKNKKK